MLDLDRVDHEAGRFPEDITDLVLALTARLRVAERVVDAARDVGPGDEPEGEVLREAIQAYDDEMPTRDPRSRWPMTPSIDDF